MDSEHFVTGQQGEFYVTPEVQVCAHYHNFLHQNFDQNVTANSKKNVVGLTKY